MSGKRSAPYHIDQKTLQQKQVQQTSNLVDTNGKSDNGSIEGRKIFKIRMPKTDGLQSQNKVNFKLQREEVQQNPIQQLKKQQTQIKADSLFKNLAKPPSNGIGLFSNISTLGFSNLFTSNKNTEYTAKQTANLFSSNKNTEDIAKQTVNKSNIFANKTPNLFENIIKPPQENSSIFRQNQQQSSDQGDQKQDSAQLQKQQQLQNNPEKSQIKYQYKQLCPIILSVKCTKFKKNAGDLISNVKVILQKDQQNNIHFISVKLNETKNTIFSGLLIKEKSSVRHLNNKQQNVQVTTIYKQKQNILKGILKFQFSDKEEGSQFYKQVLKIVKCEEMVFKDGN